MELTYTKVVDYYIPGLILDEEPEIEEFYGKYGSLRRKYIREHRPALWASLVNSSGLDDHLTTDHNRAADRNPDGQDAATDAESRWCDREAEGP